MSLPLKIPILVIIIATWFLGLGKSRFIVDDQFNMHNVQDFHCLIPFIQNANITLRSGTKAPMLVPPGTQIEIRCLFGYSFGRHLHPSIIKICTNDGEWSTINDDEFSPGDSAQCGFVPEVFAAAVNTAPNYLLPHVLSERPYLRHHETTTTSTTTTTTTTESSKHSSVDLRCSTLFVENGAVLAYTGYKRVSEVTDRRTQLLPGNRIRVICDPGYVLSEGPEYSFCLTDGQWSNNLGKCISLKFENPPSASSHRFLVTLSSDSNKPQDANGQVVSAKIVDESSTSSTTTETTMTTTSTTTEPTTTTSISTTLEPTATTTVVNTDEIAVLFQFINATGTPASLTEHNESPAIFKNCGPVPLLLNGLISEEGSSFTGSIRKVTCNFGYTLSGSENVVCTDDGLWLVDSVCSPACVTLPEIENGVVETLGTRSDVGTHRKFRCNKGFHLHGSNVMKCDDGGNWIIEGYCDRETEKLMPLEKNLNGDVTIAYMDEGLANLVPQSALNVTAIAFLERHTVFDRVKFISEHFNKHYGNYWATVIGPPSTAISGKFVAPNYVMLRRGDVEIVIFKETCSAEKPHITSFPTSRPLDTSKFYFLANTHRHLSNATKQDALNFVTLAFKLYKGYDEIANFVQNQFNLAYDGDWLCVVGPSTFDVFYWYEQPLFISIGKLDDNVSINIIHPPVCSNLR